MKKQQTSKPKLPKMKPVAPVKPNKTKLKPVKKVSTYTQRSTVKEGLDALKKILKGPKTLGNDKAITKK